MKLIGDLKKKVEKAKDRTEVKELIEEAGISLTDEELDQVSGGTNVGCNHNVYVCPRCGSTNVKLIAEVGDMGKFQCNDCGEIFYSDI